jgi:hypothetical protein
VVKNFTESNWIELGILTNTITLDEVESRYKLFGSFDWNNPDNHIVALTFLRDMIVQDNENLKIVQNYVAKICTDFGENISSELSEGRKIVFSPTIFNIPNDMTNPTLISVMMPFQAELSPVYQIIKEASEEAGFSCKRADDIWEHSTVIQDIFSLIFQSFIVVCDFTGKNPNVFYEAGIAHTLGKHVIPITQSEHDIPFDLKHHRFAKYLNNSEGLQKLKQDLMPRFKTLSR